MYSLAEATGAPRPWRGGGVLYLVNRLTPRGHGVQRAFLEVAAAAEDLLETLEGQALLAWSALYRHNPGLDLARAEAIVRACSPEEFAELVRLHTAHRARKPRPPGPPADWGTTLGRLLDAGIGTWEAILDMTFDEIECAHRRGDDPDDDVSPDEFLEMCRANAADAAADADADDQADHDDAAAMPAED